MASFPFLILRPPLPSIHLVPNTSPLQRGSSWPLKGEAFSPWVPLTLGLDHSLLWWPSCALQAIHQHPCPLCIRCPAPPSSPRHGWDNPNYRQALSCVPRGWGQVEDCFLGVPVLISPNSCSYSFIITLTSLYHHFLRMFMQDTSISYKEIQSPTSFPVSRQFQGKRACLPAPLNFNRLAI